MVFYCGFLFNSGAQATRPATTAPGAAGGPGSLRRIFLLWVAVEFFSAGFSMKL